MEVMVTYKKPQVLQALRYHFITRKEIRIMVILINVFALFAAALFFFRKVSPFAFFISTFLWLSFMIVFWWWMPAVIYRRSATFRDSLRVSLEENHFFIQNPRGSKTWAWREFSDFIETPQFFHLYFDSRSFFLLPKDVFRDGDELQAARLLLRGKIPGKKVM